MQLDGEVDFKETGLRTHRSGTIGLSKGVVHLVEEESILFDQITEGIVTQNAGKKRSKDFFLPRSTISRTVA